MKPIQQGDDYVIEWNGYKAVAPTEALCIRVFEEMLLENARADAEILREIKSRAAAEKMRQAICKALEEALAESDSESVKLTGWKAAKARLSDWFTPSWPL